MADMRDRLIELLAKYFTIGDSYAYNLTRVKEAFAVGTVTIDDFVEFDDEVVADIADHLLANGVILPPCKVGDAVYDASEFFDGTLYPELYLLQDNTMEIKKTDNGYRFTYDGMFLTKDDIGKTLFLTREEAEKAIKERNSNEKR